MDASLAFCVSSGLLPPDTPHVIQHGMGQLLGELARQPQHSILAQARAAAAAGAAGAGGGGGGQQQGEQGEDGLGRGGGGGGGSAMARAVAAVEGIIGYRFRYPVLCAQVCGSVGRSWVTSYAYRLASRPTAMRWRTSACVVQAEFLWASLTPAAHNCAVTPHHTHLW